MTAMKTVDRVVMNPGDAIEFLTYLPEDTNVMLYGEPGVGKTDLVHQLAQTLGASVVEVRMSQVAPHDIGGIPALGDHAFRYQPPEILYKLTKEYAAEAGLDPDAMEPVILFLDELTQAAADQQAPLLALLQGRKFGIGDFHLRDNVRLIGAGNRDDHNVGAKPLKATTRTRVLSLEVASDAEQWAEWARSQGLHPDVVSFIMARPSLLNGFDGHSGADAMPTSRTWHKAAVLLSHLEEKDAPEKAIRQALNATVGSGAAGELFTHMRTAEKVPDGKTILQDPENAEVYRGEVDLRIVAVENVLYAMKKDPNLTEAAFRYLERAGPSECCLGIWVVMGARGNPRDARLFEAMFAMDGDLRKRVQSVSMVTGERVRELEDDLGRDA